MKPRVFRKVCVLGILLSILSSPGARAQTSSGALDTLGTLGDLVSVYKWSHDLLTNYGKCRGRGFSDSLCLSAAQYCAISSLPTGGVAGTFFNLFQTWEAFKRDCGDGQCFACCLQPGGYGGGGCHTSFPQDDDGKPVINCNPFNYAAGTHQVGMALIVGDTVPGQACFATGQVCDHLAMCQSTSTPGQINAINSDPQNIMKSAPAIDNRAQSFGRRALGDWTTLLAGYSTSSTSSSSIVQHSHSLSSLETFITGRGCAGWRDRLPPSVPEDWSEAQFRINDTSGNYADQPSQLNALRQLGLVRFISSIPNLWNRLAYVESIIWTPAAIDQYLAGIDADAVLLQSMSPLALDILKKNEALQDYRLLAVPLPGETVSPRMFNGCLLADPPAVTLSYQPRNTFGIDLTVRAADSATTSDLEVGLVVLWGDGSMTRLTVPPGNQQQTVAHDYAAGGKYQVFALAQNNAGLKAAGAAVVTTAGHGVNPAPAPLAVISEVQLVDLQAKLVALTGGPAFMQFELSTSPVASESNLIGVSAPLPLPLNTLVSFGTVAGWSSLGAPLQSVSLRPSFWGDGPVFGFASNKFTLDRLRIGVYSTEDRALRYQDIPVTAGMVRLYPQGSNVPLLLTQPTFDPQGRLEIPEQAGGVAYDRVELILPPAVLAQTLQGPVVDDQWSGVTGTFTELKPSDDHQIPPPASQFYTVTPCRVLDTRGAAGPLGAPTLQPGGYRSFASAGVCGIPGDATALSVNVTAVQGTAAGDLRIFPGVRPFALTSAINFSPAQIRANNQLLGLSRDGTGTFTVQLDSSGTVDLIVDVNGYFK
jgi:hypothetical protein